MVNTLYYGDNLDVLRNEIGDESVDLIYLDPPFNSNANYNVLFAPPRKLRTAADAEHAQVRAFVDTWRWNDAAEQAFDDVSRSGNSRAFDLLRAMRDFLGENDMMAYLAMMAVRLIELHRVLKSTGSLYLHCDPTASHYLKLLLDGVFGPRNFRGEIIWKRTSAHNGARRWGPIHDVILFFSKSSDYRWEVVRLPYDEAYVERFYRFVDEQGRRYRKSDLTGSGTRNGESGRPWGGFDPSAHGRHWGIPGIVKEAFGERDLAPHRWLDFLRERGLIDMGTDGTGWPHVRRYLDQMSGLALQDIVDDVPPLSQRTAERLGYPTQKPLALLERIVAASSNGGDVVLDPFCGCGTAVHAAQKLDRRWIGIDVTHLAVALVERRMKAAFPGIAIAIEGRPCDLASALDLARRDKFQFQYWAVSAIGAVPFQGGRKGPDGGIDGLLYFRPEGKRTERAIVSVKGGGNVGVGMVRDLHSAMTRERAPIGVLVTAAPPTGAMEREAAAVGRFHSEATGRSYARLQILTLREICEGRTPDIPFADPDAAFRRAGREEPRQAALL